MESIDRWLKSLRLHKYTPLFKSLTYDDMLNLEEKYLIELDITKGARNKILVSIKKLNLRQDRLMNMIDDLDQDNISLKEALTVLKDMLITPIPYPPSESSSPGSISPSTGRGGGSGGYSGSSYNSDSDACSIISTGSLMSTDSPTTMFPKTASNNSSSNYYRSDPHELTHLFVETFVKVAQRLIESVNYEDNACHGIMAAIVDECLKHNSFTKGQKAIVARFRQHITREQKATVARFRQQHNITREQKPIVARSRQQHSITREQTAKTVGYRQHLQQQHQHQLPLRQYHQHQSQHHQVQYLHNQVQYQQQYREYSLLGPGLTFELPCLRAKAEAEKHNRHQSSFFSEFQQEESKSSCWP